MTCTASTLCSTAADSKPHALNPAPGGVLVNTGLKYTEALIELELRQRLTEKAHSIYMSDNRFYAASSLRRTGNLPTHEL